MPYCKENEIKILLVTDGTWHDRKFELDYDLITDGKELISIAWFEGWVEEKIYQPTASLPFTQKRDGFPTTKWNAPNISQKINASLNLLL